MTRVFILMSFVFSGAAISGWGQQLDASYSASIDTTELLNQKIEINRRRSESIEFFLNATDTIIYNISTEETGKTTLRILDPQSSRVYDGLLREGEVRGSFVAQSEGIYSLTLKNKTFKTSEITVNLNTVKSNGNEVFTVVEANNKLTEAKGKTEETVNTSVKEPVTDHAAPDTVLVKTVKQVNTKTAEFLSKEFNIGRKGSEVLEFSFKRPDTIVYHINKIEGGKVAFQIINPKGLFEFDGLLSDGAVEGSFAAEVDGKYIFRAKNKGFGKSKAQLNLSTLNIITDTVQVVTKLGEQQPQRIYSTFTSGKDTIDFISHTFQLGRIGKKAMSFSFQNTDTVLYSFSKANDLKTSLEITAPDGGFVFKNSILAEGASGFFVPDTTGAYTFSLSNRSLKTNEVFLDLKTVKAWTKERLNVKAAPPGAPPIIYDTIPEILIEETVYLGAKKDILSDHEKILDFEFSKDAIPAYGTYVVAMGKDYGEEINAMVDLVTQEPIGDPLVAYGRKKINSLPADIGENISFQFKGRGVYITGKTDQYDEFNFPSGKYEGKYEIALSNSDRVIGAYIYVKVVSFKRVPQTE